MNLEKIKEASKLGLVVLVLGGCAISKEGGEEGPKKELTLEVVKELEKKKLPLNEVQYYMGGDGVEATKVVEKDTVRNINVVGGEVIVGENIILPDTLKIPDGTKGVLVKKEELGSFVFFNIKFDNSKNVIKFAVKKDEELSHFFLATKNDTTIIWNGTKYLVTKGNEAKLLFTLRKTQGQQGGRVIVPLGATIPTKENKKGKNKVLKKQKIIYSRGN